MSPAPASTGAVWRVVPDSLSMAHLRRMEVRQPHLVVEHEQRRLVADLPDRTRWTVGRHEHSDLVIAWDASVSRTHLTIERLSTLVVVEDSGVSRNQTLVNGKRAVGRVRLGDLDEITLGHTTLVVRLPEAVKASAETITVGRATPPSNLELTPAELRVVAVLTPVVGEDGVVPRIPSNREAAELLGLGIETVRSHLKSIAKKLAATGVQGRIDRIKLAELAAQGVFEQPPS